MELPGKRNLRGRPKRRFMDVMKEDMAEVEVTEEDTEVRNNWRWKIRWATPDGKSRKKGGREGGREVGREAGRQAGREGVNYGVGAYGMKWLHNRQRERSWVTS